MKEVIHKSRENLALLRIDFMKLPSNLIYLYRFIGNEKSMLLDAVLALIN